MKKQTAVEMIFESFFDMKWEDMQDWQKPVIFLQAKEMEKEQIENAYDKGQESEWHKSMGLMGDHYYNETFNSK
jgi:inosine/xanthosine triphosphate pyrophosphatase family protein